MLTRESIDECIVENVEYVHEDQIFIMKMQNEIDVNYVNETEL